MQSTHPTGAGFDARPVDLGAVLNQIMKNIIQFHIYKGDEYYVAQGVDFPVVTQVKTLDELSKNIKEAVELALEGENLADFDLSPNPQILLNVELGAAVYA